jgi:uncharacterized membrane protein YphA (DoxX/SURF4 family)
MGFILLCARWLVAGIFLRAALSKITNMKDFRLAVENYRILPHVLVPVVAFCLPFAEGVASILLMAGILVSPVAALLASLLVIFAAAIAVNLANGRVFDCGCMGAAPQRIGWSHVTLNMVLAALAIAIALAPPGVPVVWAGVSSPYNVPTPQGDILPAGLAVLLAFAMVTLARRAIAISRLRPALQSGVNDGIADPGKL